MQKTSNIANTETNVSINRQFSVFHNFARNNPQITYFICPKNKNVDKIENIKTSFYKKIENRRNVLDILCH